MAASINDKLTKSYSFLTKSLSSSISSVDTTIPFNNVTNVPTDTAVHFIIDRVDSNGTATPTARELCKGVVSGSNLINCTRGLHGTTAQSHASGAVVEFVTSAVGLNEMVDHLLTEHNQDGTHGTALVTSLTEDTAPDFSADYLLTYDTSGTALKKVKPSTLGIGAGWVAGTGTWTYASATTFTVPATDASSMQTGTNIKMTNSGTKYFKVQSVSGTTITIFSPSGDTLANAAITSPYYNNPAPIGSTSQNPWYTEIARTTLSVAGDTITVSNIPARNYLRVLFKGIATAGTLDTNFKLNNDGAANYSSNAINAGAYGSTLSASNTAFEASTAASGQLTFGFFECINLAANEKLGILSSIADSTAGAANAPSQYTSNFKWANTAAQINRIDWVNTGGGDFAIGSEVIVLGHD